MVSDLVSDFERRIDYTFNQRKLGRIILHYNPANGKEHQFFERLEFLGDRVLGLVIADMIIGYFPENNEGDLANRHKNLVCRDALCNVAGSLNLADYIVWTGQNLTKRGRQSIVVDTVEALIAGLYIDGGLVAADAFIRQWWQDLLDSQDKTRSPVDAKSSLQTWALARGLPLPHYQVDSRAGPVHAPVFTIRVCLDGHPEHQGKGSSKNRAEQEAAADFLKHHAPRSF